MTPQLNPDVRLDHILNALRTTEPPTGLEERVAQRIAVRLAQAAEARSQPSPSSASSCFAVILDAVKDPRILLAPPRLYSVAALTLLVALTTLTIVHRRPAANTAQADFNAHSNLVTQDHASNSLLVARDHATNFGLEGAGLPSRHNTFTRTSPLAAEGIASPRPTFAAPDLDQIALAETLAPSRAAPPLPLTAQEHLILAATRPGQPLQLAELDLARAPHLRAATQAREDASIDRYVKSLLAPFAVADALQPTTDSQPQEASSPAQPTSN